MSSWTSLMPTAWPAKTVLKLIFFFAQTVGAATRDHDGFIVEGIVDVRQAGVGARRRLVDLRGTLHVQGLVRPLVVEDLDELVEPSLLLQKIGSRRLGGFSLQGQMHALMAAVLLRMTRLDPFNANTQPEPPDRQVAHVKQGMGGSEGHAVVAADGWRQGAALNKPLQHSESLAFPGRRKGS